MHPYLAATILATPVPYHWLTRMFPGGQIKQSSKIFSIYEHEWLNMYWYPYIPEGEEHMYSKSSI